MAHVFKEWDAVSEKMKESIFDSARIAILEDRREILPHHLLFATAANSDLVGLQLVKENPFTRAAWKDIKVNATDVIIFSDMAFEILTESLRLSKNLGKAHLETIHLLRKFLSTKDDRIIDIFKTSGIDCGRLISLTNR